MRLLIQGVLLLTAAGEDSRNHPSSRWVVGGALAIMGLCWLALSVMNKGKASVWKDDDSEIDSSSDVGSSG